MACTGNLAPVNMMDTNNLQKCDVTCNYQFSYGTSTCKVTPNGNYLSYKYDGTSNVTYNDTSPGSKYNVEEIRIYAPPLNKYASASSKSAAAELFIHHTSPTTGKNLLVCVPIAVDNATSRASQIFSQIITNAIDKDSGMQSLNVNNFTLDALVPLTEFYQYNGNIPYSPTGNTSCSNTNADIILFPANNSINMTPQTFSILSKLVIANSVLDLQMPSNVGMRYNERGTTSNEGEVGDDIYIECNPVGDDGEDIGPGETSGESSGTSSRAESDTSKSTGYVVDLILKSLAVIAGIAIIALGARYINNYLSKVGGVGVVAKQVKSTVSKAVKKTPASLPITSASSA